ncbi:hypothetical protein HanPSC8_Chr08g0334911 [Helianthus annuus]|nr:hypothetical protein HanPSC8_Chr08g0334911 [Helianthus annuus]
MAPSSVAGDTPFHNGAACGRKSTSSCDTTTIITGQVRNRGEEAGRRPWSAPPP